MKVINNPHEIESTGSVVTVGNFDGIHLGHQKILKKLVCKAEQLNAEAVVFSFWPHPRKVFTPSHPLNFISSIEERIQKLKNLGVGKLILFPFDINFSKLTYHEFVTEYLVNKLSIKHLALGYNHRFGFKQEGNFIKLKPLSENFNFSIEEVGPYLYNDKPISSSLVRELITNGNMEDVNIFLDEPYQITGTVVHGEKLGRKIGYPTANIEPLFSEKIIPAEGVYAAKIMIINQEHNAMVSIGKKPTFHNSLEKPVIEANVFNFDKNIYDHKVTLLLLHRIRGQKKLNGLEELRREIKNDELKIRKLLNIGE